jgi:succinate dehydrogenase/fumarate reductase flavoprotein subunit
VKHLPEERIRQIEDVLFTTERPAQKRFFEQRGIDFRHQDIELGPTEYWLCAGHGISGLVVDARARTTLEGLYAAGDVAAVGFQYLTGALVLGEVAAEEATVAARPRPLLPPPPDQVAAVEGAVGEALAPKAAAEVTIHDFEYKVRRLINDYVVPPKNTWKLQNAIGWMRRLREDLKRVVRIRDAHEVARSLEVGCILDCAELSATASLTRTESRWGTKHYRSDYPERDDAHWLRYVVLRRGPDGAISVTCPPVKRLGQEAKR